MRFEIVTHCYYYSRLLTYQLSSFALHPPGRKVHVTATVFYEPNDADTVATLQWFAQQKVVGVTWNFVKMKRINILKRAIGRNKAAKETKADWVWFTDADHFFLEDVFQKLKDEVLRHGHPLLFSQRTRCCRTHALGDDYIQRVKRPMLYAVDRYDFALNRYRTAVGASQIIQGDIAREYGYLPDSYSQKPCKPDSEVFQQCHSDKRYRKYMKAKLNGMEFVAIFIPNVYRLRHSQQGRNGLVQL